MYWYRLILAIHLIAVISWMAGILYLYRLFVYHAAETEAVVKSRFVMMEERLARIIMLPAMVATLVFGIIMLALNPDLLRQGWMHAKLLFVAGLMFMTHFAGSVRRELEAGTCKRSSKFFRFANEVPTLMMIGIILMVILRPF